MMGQQGPQNVQLDWTKDKNRKWKWVCGGGIWYHKDMVFSCGNWIGYHKGAVFSHGSRLGNLGALAQLDTLLGSSL